MFENLILETDGRGTGLRLSLNQGIYVRFCVPENPESSLEVRGEEEPTLLGISGRFSAVQGE